MTTSENRLGVTLTLSAIALEYDALGRELNPFRDSPDLIEYLGDISMRSSLEEIKKRANRIMVMAEVEMTRLSTRLNRHAVAAE